MKKNLLTASIFSLLMLPSVSIGQVNQDWVRKFVGLGVGKAVGIAADNSGNVFICGHDDFVPNNAVDMFIVKYNSSGLQTAGVLYGTPGNRTDQARGITTDRAGNVYVVGRVTTFTNITDIVIVKFNSSLNQQWATIFNTPQNYTEDATSIAVDDSGNVYIGGNILKETPFSNDYLTLKLNSAGIVQWFATYNGTANESDLASDIAVDAVGNVFVTGSSKGQIGNLFVIKTGFDYLTIKYNSSGVQQWVKRYNANNGNDDARSLALDAAGNVYVTGSVAVADPNFDCMTIKYSTDGVVQWSQRISGSAGGRDVGNAIVVDGSGNAFITGVSNNSTAKGNVLTAKYNPSGVQQWIAINDQGAAAHDEGKAIGLDQFGNVYVAAQTIVPGGVNSNFLTIKYSGSGAQLWVTRYNGPENKDDNPTSMAVVNPLPSPAFQNAAVYVYGASAGDVITIKYSQPLISTRLLSRELVTEKKPETVAEKWKNFKISHQPNPASSYVDIQFDLPADSRVTIEIYDPIGRKVYSLVDGFRKAGTHITKLNVATLAEGTYYYKFYARAGGKEFRQAKTIVIHR